jgi:futalosine hydrolase
MGRVMDLYRDDAHRGKRILIITSVAAEKDAVRSGLKDCGCFEVVVGGVGPAAAAASTATELAKGSYDLVINAGIAGGFKGKAEVGSLVLASEMIAADLGAQTPEGFLSLDELGFGSTRMSPDSYWTERLMEAFRASGIQVHSGPILTVSTVTGTEQTVIDLLKRVPDAVAEAMEGYGVATAAQAHGVPILEIRAISNSVGPRDRNAWRIREALDMLEAASTALREAL